MEADGLIDYHQDHNNQPRVWMLSPTQARAAGRPAVTCPDNFYNRKHEIAVADLFVRYFPHVTHWDNRWLGTEEQFKSFGLYYDARMVIDGKLVFWEVDRGTEDLAKQVIPKVEKYVALSEAYPRDRFAVCFTFERYRRQDLNRRINDVLFALSGFRRGDQFLVAKHAEACADPLGAVFVSPKDPTSKQPLLKLLA